MEKPFALKNFLLTNFSPKQIFLKNTFWLFLAQIVSRVLKFILVVIAARILGPQQYGAFNYVLSIIGFFFIFADFGINTLTIRDYQQKKADKKYLNAALFFKIILTVGSLIIAFIGLFVFESLEFRKIALFLILFSFLTQIREYFLSLNRALQKMENEFKAILIESIFNLILGVGLVIIYQNAVSLSIGYFLAILISVIFTVIITLKNFKDLKPEYDKEFLIYFLKNGTPLLLFGLLSFVFFSTDQFLLGYLKGVENVGYWTIITKIISIVELFPSLIMTALFPYLASQANNLEKSKEIFKKVLSFLIISAIIISILGVLLSPLIPIIFGKDYSPSVEFFRIFIWIIVFLFPTTFLDSFLVARNKIWQDFYFTIIAASLNLILNIILIPKLGIWGVVYSGLIAQFINFSLTFYLGYKSLKIKNSH